MAGFCLTHHNQANDKRGRDARERGVFDFVRPRSLKVEVPTEGDEVSHEPDSLCREREVEPHEHLTHDGQRQTEELQVFHNLDVLARLVGLDGHL